MLKICRILLIMLPILFLTSCSANTPADIESKPSTMNISCKELAKEIFSNGLQAKEKFDGKVLSVTGTIDYIGKSDDNDYPYVIHMNTCTFLMYSFKTKVVLLYQPYLYTSFSKVALRKSSHSQFLSAAARLRMAAKIIRLIIGASL